MAAGETSKTPESKTGRLRTGPRVLVASSDSATQEFLSRIARHTGAEVAVADDGVEALNLARQLDLDVVILDAHLRVNDGITVCGQIRRLSGSQPMIVLAGLSAGRLLERAVETDADDLLVKPLLAGVVHRRIDNLLRQRRTQNELALLKRAFQVAGAGITLLDARSTEYPVTHVNDGFCKMTGYARQELIGKNLRMLNGPETDVAAMAQLREAFTRGQECRVVLKNYRKDGSMFWNELAMTPMRDKAGRLTHWVGIQSDARDRIKVDELSSQNREAEQNFAAQLKAKNDTLSSLEMRRRFNEMLLNSISAGLIATDHHLNVVFINRAAQEVLQISLADCLEQPLLEIFGGSDDIARELENLTEQRWTEFDLVSAGGVLLHIGLTIMPAPEEFSDTLGVVVLFRDLGAVQADEEAYAPSQELVPEGEDDAAAIAPIELVKQATAEAGLDPAPTIESSGPLPQVWVDSAVAIEVLRDLAMLSTEVAGNSAGIAIELGVETLDEAGSEPAVGIDYRLSNGADAATAPRPADFQERLEAAAGTLHAIGGELLVTSKPKSSLILSALLPAVSSMPS
jgi:PAS domain S-box-containing protein